MESSKFKYTKKNDIKYILIASLFGLIFYASFLTAIMGGGKVWIYGMLLYLVPLFAIAVIWFADIVEMLIKSKNRLDDDLENATHPLIIAGFYLISTILFPVALYIWVKDRLVK